MASAPLQRPRPKGSHDGRGVLRVLPCSTLPLQGLLLSPRQGTEGGQRTLKISDLQSLTAP